MAEVSREESREVVKEFGRGEGVDRGAGVCGESSGAGAGV